MQRQRETGWGFAVCRHREWQGNSGRGTPQYRLVDRLNCRGLPCAGWRHMRLSKVVSSISGLARRLIPSAVPGARARRGCSKCLATPLWHTDRNKGY